jgi:predicted amidohydrolase
MIRDILGQNWKFMKVASLQYRYDFPSHFDAYRKKIADLVAQQEQEGVELLVFPEYAALEMLAFASLEELYENSTQYMDLYTELSVKHRMLICAGTHLIKTQDGVFNRSLLFAPSGKCVHQDKCVLTPTEVGECNRGREQSVFETKWGKIAICVCYDVEFPSLVKKVVDAGAHLILVPSYTSSVHGFYRVFTSCRARALENQCYVVQSAIVGQTDVEMAYGAAAICSPIDAGFPEDGVLALGTRDQVDSVCATLDFLRLQEVRAHGQTRNYEDGKILEQQRIGLRSLDLR